MRDHGHVLLALVAQLDDVGHLLLGRANGVAPRGLHQNAKQGVAVEHSLRQRHRHKHQLVGIHAQALATAAHNTHHPKTPVTNTHQLSLCGRTAKNLVAHLGANHRLRSTPAPVTRRQKTPLCQRQHAHLRILRHRAGNYDLAQLATGADLGRAHGHRCHAVDGAGTLQGLGVINGQVPCGVGDGVAGVETTGL